MGTEHVKCLLVALACACAGTAHAAVEFTCGSLLAPARDATSAVAYFAVTNYEREERELLKITSSAATWVRLQQNSVDANGVEHSWPMASLRLRPGQTVRFSLQNGKHLLLEGLSERLRPGMRVPVSLQFDGGGPPVTLLLVVRTSKQLQAGPPGCAAAASSAD